MRTVIGPRRPIAPTDAEIDRQRAADDERPHEPFRHQSRPASVRILMIAPCVASVSSSPPWPGTSSAPYPRPTSSPASRRGGRVDLRATGSRNPGALNARASSARRAGAPCWSPTSPRATRAARAAAAIAGDLGAHVAGVSAVVGHCYPAWNGFDGGKGLATSFGQCLYTFPVSALRSTSRSPSASPGSRPAAGRRRLDGRGLDRLAAHEPRLVAQAAAELVGAEADRRALRRELRDGRDRRVALRRTRTAAAIPTSWSRAEPNRALHGLERAPLPGCRGRARRRGRRDPGRTRRRAVRRAPPTTSTSACEGASWRRRRSRAPATFLEAYERLASRGCRQACSRSTSTAASRACRSRPRSRHATRRCRFASCRLPTVSYGVGLCVRAARAALRGGASVTRGGRGGGADRDVARQRLRRARRTGRRVSRASDGWTLLRFARWRRRARLGARDARRRGATQAMTRRILGGRPGLVAVGHAGSELEAAADRLAHELVGRFRRRGRALSRRTERRGPHGPRQLRCVLVARGVGL